jgi:hypothetical protein
MCQKNFYDIMFAIFGDMMLKEVPPPITLIGGMVAISGVALIKKDSHRFDYVYEIFVAITKNYL